MESSVFQLIGKEISSCNNLGRQFCFPSKCSAWLYLRTSVGPEGAVLTPAWAAVSVQLQRICSEGLERLGQDQDESLEKSRNTL